MSTPDDKLVLVPADLGEDYDRVIGSQGLEFVAYRDCGGHGPYPRHPGWCEVKVDPDDFHPDYDKLVFADSDGIDALDENGERPWQGGRIKHREINGAWPSDHLVWEVALDPDDFYPDWESELLSATDEPRFIKGDRVVVTRPTQSLTGIYVPAGSLARVERPDYQYDDYPKIEGRYVLVRYDNVTQAGSIVPESALAPAEPEVSIQDLLERISDLEDQVQALESDLEGTREVNLDLIHDRARLQAKIDRAQQALS